MNLISPKDIPIATKDSDIPDRFWADKKEPYDHLIPPNTWISDVIYHNRGIETPTLFQLWATLWGLSAATNRRSWIELETIHRRYPVLFVCLTGPPRITGKGTIIRKIVPLVAGAAQHIDNPAVRQDLYLKIAHSRMTPEAFLSRLAPADPRVQDPTTGNVLTQTQDARMAVVVEELNSLFNRSKYLDNMTNLFTDLYDAKDKDEVNTISRGLIELNDVFVTLISGTNQEQLVTTLPPSIHSDGFLSRITIVYLGSSTRLYPKPRVVDGSACEIELQRRLAWCLYNGYGAFEFSPDAEKMWDSLYKANRLFIDKNSFDHKASSYFRYDVHLRTLALLIRLSRYEPGRTITDHDLHWADIILKATLETSQQALLGMSDSREVRHAERVQRMIQSHKSVNRADLRSWVSRYMSATELTMAIAYLVSLGYVAISLDGNYRPSPGPSGKEVYTWVGGKN